MLLQHLAACVARTTLHVGVLSAELVCVCVFIIFHFVTLFILDALSQPTLRSMQPKADTMYNVALVHKRLHNYTRCVASFESAAFSMAQVHGPDHPDVLDANLQVGQPKTDGNFCFKGLFHIYLCCTPTMQ